MKPNLKIENDRVIMFPGSFDPFHSGHQVLVEKALQLFDQVVIVVSRNPEKTYQHSGQSRVEMIETIFQTNPRVKVMLNEHYLTAVFAQMHQINYCLRGFRNDVDFAYEAKIASYNKVLNPQLELVYFFSQPDDKKTSSTLLKEIKQYKKENNYE
ncbi:pantetheine-phosphate adenylyltransferase [Mesoplasma whartonense]|uniref:pantetheine-phosphate adenylyltransferase n=1 Tax=Mesoplasma whartonense TaxID=2878854 RepID=UPI002022B2E0|nr:pantetheine-phosphate adenylyltransferase [Mesoplasma sp. JKS002660]